MAGNLAADSPPPMPMHHARALGPRFGFSLLAGSLSQQMPCFNLRRVQDVYSETATIVVFAENRCSVLFHQLFVRKLFI